MLNPLLASLLSWKSEDFLSDPREGREVESVAVSNRDCVGVRSCSRYMLNQAFLGKTKDNPYLSLLSFLFSGAELKKNGSSLSIDN